MPFTVSSNLSKNSLSSNTLLCYIAFLFCFNSSTRLHSCHHLEVFVLLFISLCPNSSILPFNFIICLGVLAVVLLMVKQVYFLSACLFDLVHNLHSPFFLLILMYLFMLSHSLDYWVCLHICIKNFACPDQIKAKDQIFGGCTYEMGCSFS